MWRVCVQPSVFCKLLFAENKRLIRPIQTSLHTSKEVVLTQGKGKIHVSPRRNYPLHRYFQFTLPRFWKINTLSSSARSLPFFVVSFVKWRRSWGLYMTFYCDGAFNCWCCVFNKTHFLNHDSPLKKKKSIMSLDVQNTLELSVLDKISVLTTNKISGEHETTSWA